MKTNYTERLRQISALAKAELSLIFKYSEDYSKAFPADIRSGILFFDGDTKAITDKYYTFISSVAKSLSSIDGAFSGISSVITEADSAGDTATIYICDQALSRYSELRTSINSFASKNEKDIVSKCFSAAKAYKHLNELNYKLNYFLKFLDALNI